MRGHGGGPAGAAAAGADEALLRSFLDPRGEATFERLVVSHRDGVFDFARSIVRDDALADDIVQDTFVALFRDAARVAATGAPVRPWLLRVARVRALNATRAVRRRRFREAAY